MQPKTNSLFKFKSQFFFALKEISKSTYINLQIPDTLITGFGFTYPTLFSTNLKTGELIIKSRLSSEAIEEIFTYFEEQEFDHTFPIAVFKTSNQNDEKRNEVLFTANDCMEKWFNNDSKNCCIQRYIRNNRGLSVIQSIWDNVTSTLDSKRIQKLKKTQNPEQKKFEKNSKRRLKKQFKLKNLSEDFLIININRNYTISSFISASLENKMIYLVTTIEKYFFHDSTLKIISLEADWVEDLNGNFTLISLKNYTVGKINPFKASLLVFPVPNICLSSFSEKNSRPEINIHKKLKNSDSQLSSTLPNFSNQKY